MNKKGTIQPKQIAAAILMALFLFIHVVKVLHHHEGTFAKTEISQTGTSIEKSPDCSVCDYHFVKDAHNLSVEYTAKRLLILSPLYTNYLSQRLTSIGLSSSDRGPPAVA